MVEERYRPKLALHTMATPDATVAEAIRLAASLGYDGIEVICDEAYRCAITVDTAASELDALRRVAADSGIAIAGIVPYFKELNALDEAQRQQTVDGMRKAVDVAHRLGALSVRIYAGVEPSPQTAARQWDLLVASIRTIDEHGAGIRLNVENHRGTTALTSAITRRLVEAVGSPHVGIIFDPGNLWRMGEHDVAAAYRIQREYIRHVHFKDVAAAAPQLPVAAGTGAVGWPGILRALAADGYAGYVTAEYEKRWHPAVLEGNAAALRHEADFIRAQMIGE